MSTRNAVLAGCVWAVAAFAFRTRRFLADLVARHNSRGLASNGDVVVMNAAAGTVVNITNTASYELAPVMTRLMVASLTSCLLAGCSSQSPVAPGAPLPAEGGSLDAKGSTGVPGVYALTFRAGFPGYEEVSSMPVLTRELVLLAMVTDTSGNAATTGTVNFEYCSYSGPTQDITRADEAPKEACEQGEAKWAVLRRGVRVSDHLCQSLGAPSACTYFPRVTIPRFVGFRFRYAQGDRIASGTSPARNFEWTAQLP